MGESLLIKDDDFGAGYSSLSYLRRYAFEKLKINRAFVCEITADSLSLKIVQTIVALAQAQNMSVPAEGVETEEQATLLRAPGCDYAQGFFYARPAPLHQLLTAQSWGQRKQPRRVLPKHGSEQPTTP